LRRLLRREEKGGEEKEQEKGSSEKDEREKVRETGVGDGPYPMQSECTRFNFDGPSFMMAGNLSRMKRDEKGNMVLSRIKPEDVTLPWLSLTGIEPEILAQVFAKHNWDAFDAIIRERTTVTSKKKGDKTEKTGKRARDSWFEPDTRHLRLWISPDEAEVRLAGRCLAFISKVELLVSEDESGAKQDTKGSTTQVSVALGTTNEQAFKCKIKLQGGFIKRNAHCWVEVTTVFPGIEPMREKVLHAVEYCSLEEARFINLDPLNLLWAQLLRMKVISSAHKRTKISMPRKLQEVIRDGRWWKDRLVSLSRIDLYLLAGLQNSVRPISNMTLLEGEKAEERKIYEGQVVEQLLRELRGLLNNRSELLEQKLPYPVRKRLNWFIANTSVKFLPSTTPEPLIFDIRCTEMKNPFKVTDILASSLVDTHLCMPDFFQVSRHTLSILVRMPFFVGHVLLGTVVGLLASIALGFLSLVATPFLWIGKGVASTIRAAQGRDDANMFAISSTKSWEEEPVVAGLENDLFLVSNMCLAGVPVAALGARGILKLWYGRRSDDKTLRPETADTLPTRERQYLPNYESWAKEDLYVGLEGAGLTEYSDLGSVYKDYKSLVYLSKMQHLLELCGAYPSDSSYWCERKVWEMFSSPDWKSVLDGDWALHRELDVRYSSSSSPDEKRPQLDKQRENLKKMLETLDGERSKVAYGNLVYRPALPLLSSR